MDDKIDIVVTKVTTNEEPASANGDGSAGATLLEEVDVEETITLQPKPAGFFSTLLLGAPSPSSKALSAATFLLNVALVAMAVDQTYTARVYYPSEDLSFARLGYVSHTTARLLVRERDQVKMPVTVEMHLKDAVPPHDYPLWYTVGAVRWTSNATDYTAVVDMALRHSSQRTYEWRTSNGHAGEFTAPAAPGAPWTLNGGKFTFLSTSCITQRLPYSPFAHPLSVKGLRSLAALIPKLSPSFMLFLGDFIYADAPQRFGRDREAFRRKYRQVYASPDWPAAGQNLSWIHVLDDHEIANDWSSGTAGLYAAAVEPWHHYQTAANPPRAVRADGPLRTTRRGADATWFSFEQGPASFFMLDTRSYRSPNSLPADGANKTMLGADQLADLLAWLRRPPTGGAGVKWKIVASSVPLTKNWPFNGKDTWGGFLVERKQVLEAMWDASVLTGTAVVVLSGDRHEFAATKLPPPQNGTWPDSAAVHEFSVSPLNQFYSPIGTYRQKDGEDVKIKYGLPPTPVPLVRIALF